MTSGDMKHIENHQPSAMPCPHWALCPRPPRSARCSKHRTRWRQVLGVSLQASAPAESSVGLRRGGW